MRHRLLVAAAFGAAAAATAGPAQAQLLGLERLLPPPTVEFEATVVMIGDNEQAEGKVYRAPEKERREFTVEDQTQIVIVRRDLKRVWSLIPDEKIYLEMSYEDAIGRGTAKNGMTEPKITITPVGKETIEGVGVTKKKISGEDIDGSVVDGIVWISDQGVVLAAENKLTDQDGMKHRVRMELHNLKIGPQDPSLFELPPDYRPAGQTRTGSALPMPDAAPSLARGRFASGDGPAVVAA